MSEDAQQTRFLVNTAKVVRVITVPPVLVLALLLILFFVYPGFYVGPAELGISITFLMIIPTCAYPLAAMLPKYKKKGREGQRSLAFVCNLIGFAGAVIYGFAASVGQGLRLIYVTYFLSILTLLIFNKGLKIRASGHACSIAGPLILLVYFVGWVSLVPCVLLFAAVVWASLYLKRHTPKDLLWGSVSAFAAFLFAALFIVAL